MQRQLAAEEFSEGLAAFFVKERNGYIDTTGTQVIAPQFAQAQRFREGLAAVEVVNGENGKKDFTRPQRFGYVDHEGTLVVPATFGWAERFSEGLAAVRPTEAHETAYIDPTDQFVISPITCELAGPFTGGLARIQGEDGGVGYINRQGEFVWPLRG